jgi:hypothetical protein
MREVSKGCIGINCFPVEKIGPRASTLASDLNEQNGTIYCYRKKLDHIDQSGAIAQLIHCCKKA